jgi:hypothetical protein
MTRATRTRSLIIAGSALVAMSLVTAVVISTQRERRTSLEIRKQSTAILLDLTREMDQAAVAMIAFNTDGGLDLSGLEDKAALDRRIDLATRAQAAAARTLAQGESAPDRLGDALSRHPAHRVDEAKQQLAQRTEWAQGRHVFETHSRAYAAAKAHLEFLKQHHGHWRVDNVGLRVNWDSQQLQADAEKLQARVTAAAAAQASLASAASTSLPASAPARD